MHQVFCGCHRVHCNYIVVCIGGWSIFSTYCIFIWSLLSCYNTTGKWCRYWSSRWCKLQLNSIRTTELSPHLMLIIFLLVQFYMVLLFYQLMIMCELRVSIITYKDLYQSLIWYVNQSPFYFILWRMCKFSCWFFFLGCIDDLIFFSWHLHCTNTNNILCCMNTSNHIDLLLRHGSQSSDVKF